MYCQHCQQEIWTKKEVCIVEGWTLAEARYHLITKLGVSDEFIQHCQFHPWFGSGQGAGDSPTKWLVMSRATGALYVMEPAALPRGLCG